MKFLGRLLATVLVFLSLIPASMAEASPLESAIQTDLQNFLNTKKAQYKVELRSVTGADFHVSVGAHDLVEPASVFKLYYAYAALLKVDEHQFDLNTPLSNGFTWASCLKIMIQVSSNECAVYLRNGLGTDYLNDLFDSKGWADTNIITNLDGSYKTKKTSAADTADLLYQLQTGTLLSDAQSTYFHQLLSQQVFRHRITAGVQSGVRVEDKGGEYWISSGWTRSDAAIVFAPQGTYVMVIYGSKNATNADEAKLSKIAYEHIQGTAVTKANSFPKQQFITKANLWVRKTVNGRKLYVVKKNVKVEVVLAQDDCVWINVAGRRSGFVKFSELRLRNEYLWPNT